jgi:hypothetical protein
MRLSEWRATAPTREAGGPKVAAVVDAVIEALGSEPDPHCWVAWGEEPAIRYMILIPTGPGLITSFVRVNVPGEGPRATTKMIRWSRVSIGELTVETQAGQRLLSFQVEQQVLRGADEQADRVAAFALRVIAAIDGRPIPPDIERKGRGASRAVKSAFRPTRGPTPKATAAKATAAKASAPKTGRAAPPPSSRTAARGSGR